MKKHIADNRIRRGTLRCFKRVVKEKKYLLPAITLSELDGAAALISERRRENFKAFSKFAVPEKSVVFLQCLAIVAYGYALDQVAEKKLRGIKGHGTHRVRHIKSGLLVNTVNHVLATVYLMESGLDNSARVMLRTTLESTWIATALLFDEELLNIFQGVLDDETSQMKLWHKHFKPSRILERLAKLETSIGLPAEEAESIRTERREIYSYFSNSAHHSTLAALLGPYCSTPDQPKSLRFALFGLPSIAAKSHLAWIRHSLGYLQIHLFRSLDQLRDLKSRDWLLAESLLYASMASTVHLEKRGASN
jgi:hypothetical protein